jgi:hypothetical protein
MESGAFGPSDHHDSLLKGIEAQTKNTDQASAALIKNLKQRGLLDDTLVILVGASSLIQRLLAESIARTTRPWTTCARYQLQLVSWA